MLWLKAWLETRWRIAWALFMGVIILVGAPVSAGGSQGLLIANALKMFMLMSFLAPLMLASSGIQTSAATRPGASEKGAEGSTLFTLSLPVTRNKLFAVRTVFGILETIALLSLFSIAAWLLMPMFRVNAHDALGALAVIIASSMTVYAISACLSTFCDESWRIRLSALAVVGVFILLPKPFDIIRPLVVASPLITHQIPWVTIVAACVLAALFLAIALKIIQTREY